MRTFLKNLILASARRTTVGNGWLLARTYGRDVGWTQTMLSRQLVNAEGYPIPWMNYSAIRFLESRVPNSAKVFEWGSGSSTAWWAQHLSQGTIVSCEHDAEWSRRAREGLPANAYLREVPLGSDYAASVSLGGPWDAVVVDGRDRVECMLLGADHLSPQGVIILDDSDRPRYADGLEEMTRNGFRRIDLLGLKPLSWSEHMTSVLYRPGRNLLGL